MVKNGNICYNEFNNQKYKGSLKMSDRVFNTLEEKVEFIDFRQELLFINDDVSRILFEYEITKQEQLLLMDLMDNYRSKITNRESITSHSFENEVYRIIPTLDGNYHFCESITRAYHLNGQWEEVFINLYGDLPQYRNR